MTNFIPTGDYVVEVLDRFGQPLPGYKAHFATYQVAYDNAPALAQAAGCGRWRIMKCMANSTDAAKERWDG